MSTENQTDTDLRTPTEWCRLEGVEILDADGWRGPDARDFTDPITVFEFRARLVTCTQRSLWAAAQPVGLEDRYDVQRRDDTSGKHANCRYFVLDPQHDQFARVAMWHYATACEPTQLELARDLTSWLNRVTPVDQDPPTQPASEHHTGTLNLAGQGNPGGSPISDELADAVLTVKERGVPCPPNCDYQTHRRAEVRAELEAAYPAIRQQVAEQIAAKLDDCSERLKRTADRNRQRSIDLGDRSTYERECLMRMAVSQNNRAQGIRDAAEVVREFGGQA